MIFLVNYLVNTVCFLLHDTLFDNNNNNDNNDKGSFYSAHLPQRVEAQGVSQ